MLAYEALESTNKRKKLTLLVALVAVVSIGIIVLFGVSQSQYNLSTTTNGKDPSIIIGGESEGDSDESSESLTYSRVEIGEGYECNDGTAAIFYIDLAEETSPNADKWYIELPGGGTCFSINDCAERWDQRSSDMSTDYEELKEFGEEGGLASANETLNPYFYNYNRVVGHYCTSDSWMGQVTAEDNPSEYSFLGATNVFAMMDKLYNDYAAFRSAGTYLVGGISVGGTGILNLADGLDEALHAANPHSERYFISDCGWDLEGWNQCNDDICPTDSSSDEETTADTGDTTPFSENNAIIDTYDYLNAGCAEVGDTDDCAWGEFVYPFIQAKDHVFVVQQLYDFQMMPWTDSLWLSGDQWNDAQIEWGLNRTEALIESYLEAGVTNVFSSNCRSHDYTEHDAVYTTVVEDTSFAYHLNNFINSAGQVTFYSIDEDHMPESNPTCDTTFFCDAMPDEPACL